MTALYANKHNGARDKNYNREQAVHAPNNQLHTEATTGSAHYGVATPYNIQG